MPSPPQLKVDHYISLTTFAPYIEGFEVTPEKLFVLLPGNARFLSAEGNPEYCVLSYLIQNHDVPEDEPDAELLPRPGRYPRRAEFRWVPSGEPLSPWLLDCTHRHSFAGYHLFEFPDWALEAPPSAETTHPQNPLN